MDKRKVAFLSILLLSALLAPFSIKTAYSSPSRNMPPIVSTAWLYAHLGLVDIVVLDVRSPEEYNANHIPGAINVPSYMWFTNPLSVQSSHGWRCHQTIISLSCLETIA